MPRFKTFSKFHEKLAQLVIVQEREYFRSKLFGPTDLFACIDERRRQHHQRGRFGIAHNTPRMAWAYKNTERENVGING